MPVVIISNLALQFPAKIKKDLLPHIQDVDLYFI